MTRAQNVSAHRLAALSCEAQTTAPGRPGTLNSLLTILHLVIKLKPIESRIAPEEQVESNDRMAMLTLFGSMGDPAVAYGPCAGSEACFRLGV